MSAYAGMYAKFMLEGMDDVGPDPTFQPTPEQDTNLLAWLDTERAAHLALAAMIVDN